MYMGLHIADPEVNRLATDLARMEKTTKTEVLRRVLREALKEREIAEKRKDFRAFAERLIAEGRKKKIRPLTKREREEILGIDPKLGY